jgi:HlyD family secretion protein
MKKLSNSIGIIVLLAIVVTLILVTRKKDTNKDLLEKTTKPFYTEITNKRLISGNLYPIKEIEIKSSISGILEQFYVEIGDKVVRGQKIAKVKLVPNAAQVEQAKNSVSTAQITYDIERANFERKKKLFGENVISREEFDEETKNFLMSKEQLDNAETQLTLLLEGSNKSGSVSNFIESTINGTVIDLPIEVGAPIQERGSFSIGTTIAVIAQLDKFVFKGKVIESDIIVMKKGMPVIVYLPVNENFKGNAIISKVSSKGNPDNGVMKYDFEALLSVPDSVTVYSGFSATAEIILDKKDSVLAIAEKNLIFENDTFYAEVLNSKMIKEKKAIKTGISDGINIEILEGLTLEDNILTH